LLPIFGLPGSVVAGHAYLEAQSIYAGGGALASTDTACSLVFLRT
jgi:hypothetical protein